MKKLLSVIFAMIIALPAMATMNVKITVIDSDGEPAIGATVRVVGTSNAIAIGTNGVPDTNATLSNVPDDANIEISYLGHETQTLPAAETMSVNLKVSGLNLDEIIVIECPGSNPAKGIKKQKNINGQCVPSECFEPCYKLKNKKCELQKTDGGIYMMDANKQCTLTCMSVMGYMTDPKNQWKCTQDCTSSITDQNVKKAQWVGNTNPQKVKCEIITCKGKYHPSDDKQSCIPDQADCSAQQLSDIHASDGYLLTQQNKCVPKECIKPQYKKDGNGDNAICVDQVGKPCNIKHATDAKYEMQNGQLVCVVAKCDASQGYTTNENKTACIKDCLSTIQQTEPLATKAEYDSQMKCIIKKCNKKDGKKYIPSDDGQKCEETERECDKTTDAAIWPEHATAASYKKSKTGGSAKCAATECEDGYDVSGGKCVSVNDSDCDTKPENSSKSHKWYDTKNNQTLCIVDECKKGYKISNDMLSCILESALSEEDAKKRMEELKANEQAMKERENSTENKLLGAAGIGAVGIGGMNIASALSEQSADRNAEEDMKAYLATFRCDYGQGRNIVGGETNIQLPGASELITYTTEYKQIAANLKADKEALGMLPGIESETVFDSATTGLYDDVSIGIQKGAFTSLSRALMDENSADAAEWQAQKDATAKKLKTGIVVAGVGAIGTLAGNLAINHGKNDQSGNIMDKYDPLKQDTPDITLERIPCSNFPGTTGTGFVPSCECQDKNAYFDEKTRTCEQCPANSHVKPDNNGCECDNGFHRDDSGTCIADVVEPKCDDYPDTNGGTYPDCICKDTNATFNTETRKCDCKDGYSNPNGQCLQSCVGLRGVNSQTAYQYTIPNCPCEYSGATFDATRNGCYCPSGQTESNEGGVKKCVTPPPAGTPCSTIAGTNGSGMIPNCTCTDPNKEFKSTNGGYACKCKNGLHEDASGQCINGTDPVFQGNFSSDTTFDLGSYDISTSKCNEIINKIKRDSQYNSQISGTLCINVSGHTDTSWFKNVDGTEDANRAANQELSEQRANAMYNCINRNIRTLFPNATVGSHNVVGHGWSQCPTQTVNTKTAECRKVELKIQLNSCSD